LQSGQQILVSGLQPNTGRTDEGMDLTLEFMGLQQQYNNAALEDDDTARLQFFGQIKELGEAHIQDPVARRWYATVVLAELKGSQKQRDLNRADSLLRKLECLADTNQAADEAARTLYAQALHLAKNDRAWRLLRDDPDEFESKLRVLKRLYPNDKII
jgi:hypothetical protein